MAFCNACERGSLCNFCRWRDAGVLFRHGRAAGAVFLFLDMDFESAGSAGVIF